MHTVVLAEDYLNTWVGPANQRSATGRRTPMSPDQIEHGRYLIVKTRVMVAQSIDSVQLRSPVEICRVRCRRSLARSPSSLWSFSTLTRTPTLSCKPLDFRLTLQRHSVLLHFTAVSYLRLLDQSNQSTVWFLLAFVNIGVSGGHLWSVFKGIALNPGKKEKIHCAQTN